MTPPRGTLLSLILVAATGVTSCNHSSKSAPEGMATSLLAVGASLPELVGTDQSGTEHQLKANKGQPLLVYFYPKDGTPGCTKEACAFRDVWKRYEHAGVSLLGVSRDDRASHERFAQEHRIPFPLIADPEGTWAKAFGVPSNNGKSARVSFLFNGNGQVDHVYANVDPGVHAEQVLSDVAAKH